jgi:hypothetical protein
VLLISMAHSSGCVWRRCGLGKLTRSLHWWLLHHQGILGRCVYQSTAMREGMFVLLTTNYSVSFTFIVDCCFPGCRVLASPHSLWSASCRATGVLLSVGFLGRCCRQLWMLVGPMRCCSRSIAASASRCTPCQAAHLLWKQRPWSTVWMCSCTSSRWPSKYTVNPMSCLDYMQMWASFCEAACQSGTHCMERGVAHHAHCHVAAGG